MLTWTIDTETKRVSSSDERHSRGESTLHPLIKDIIETLLRKGLTVVATYLVTVGLLTEGQATEAVAGLVLVGVSIAWSLWQRYKDRLHFLTAIEAPPGTPEKVVKETAKSMDAPSVI